jgi:membrane associated rhomboid family serine protease
MIPLQDTRTSGRFPFQTVLLIAITLGVFFVQVTTPNLEGFMLRYAFIPALLDFANSQTWLPLVTAVFLHGGLLHILSNMLFLWVFGDNIEERLGVLYIPFYLIGGIAANLGQYLVDPGSPIPILGASGAVAAVLGAYLVWYPHHRVKTLVPIIFFITIINLPAALLLIYWFGLQLFNGFASLGVSTGAEGGVAYFAHIVGFAVGAFGALLLGRSRGPRAQRG